MSDTVAVPRRTTVIVIDPTDRQGQDGLNAIHPAETCVAMLLPLYGRWSRALLVRDPRLSVERLHTGIPAALTITRPRPSAPYWDRRRRIRAA